MEDKEYMEWRNLKTERKVETEIEDLKKIIDIVTQWPNNNAMRMLEYAMSYISEREKEAEPLLSPDFKEAIDKVMKKRLKCK